MTSLFRFLLPICFACSAVLAFAGGNDDSKKEKYPEGPGEQWLVFPANTKLPTSQGKNVVLLAGDEESRSEEALPQLAKALNAQFGWEATVLISQDPDKGNVDPNQPDHFPNFKAIKEATLVIMSLRHRELPEKDTKLLLDYLKAGKPVLALRHSLAAFGYDKDPNDDFSYLDWQSADADWRGGFGGRVLGSRWIDQWSAPGQPTRVVQKKDATHPILAGFQEFQVPSNVTQVKLSPENAQPLLCGLVLASQAADAPLATGARKGQQINEPAMPVAWVHRYQVPQGAAGTAFTTTLGSAQDFTVPGFAQLIVNAACWLQDQPTASLSTWPKDWKPSESGFMKFRKKIKPKQLLQ